MSTRALYTFKDERGSYNVYKHHDGYPEGGLEALRRAAGMAWDLPRFEADDFSAAFVAANKRGGGGVDLLPSGEWKEVAPLDLEYRYELWFDSKTETLMVAIYSINCAKWDVEPPVWKERLLFSGCFGAALSKFGIDVLAK